MSQPFPEQVAPGGELIYPQIQSPNFSLADETGWAIMSNGDAYFYNITADGSISADSGTIEGAVFIAGGGGGTTWETAEPSAPGYFMYYDTGVGDPVLIFSAAADAGSDQWGNAWQGGVTFVGLPGVLANVLSLTDTSGDTLANMDSDGNIGAQTVNATIDTIIAGNSVAAFMADTPAGVVARGWTPGSAGTSWPSGGINAAASLTSILELDFTMQPGRDYMLQILSSTVLFSTAPSANSQYVQRLFYTTDGSTPAFTGTDTPSGTTLEVSGHSPGITPVMASTVLNYPTPYMEYLVPVPSVATTYRFLLGAYCTGSAYQFQYSNSLEMRITDLGVDAGQFGNAGTVFGTGHGGGGSGQQTYTEYFFPSDTWCYESINGLQNTNGDMYHGAYAGEPGGGYKYSYIKWASGSLGNGLNTVLGYTVNSVTLRLNNLHSWYSNGMRFGLHSSTSLGSTGYSSILNSGGTFISEGSTSSWVLSSAQWAPFAAGGTTYLVLAPDTADKTNLSWYGYFYGGGGSTNYMPCLKVVYTH